MTPALGLALSFAAAAAAGCAHGSGAAGSTAPVEVVRAGPFCGGEAEGTSARWIATEDGLRSALAADGLLGGAAPAPAPVDLAREGVVLVAMGRRPTAGYALSLAEPAAGIRDGAATVVVRFDEPPKGAVVAQVITSPCLLVRLPREGLREVRIVDPAGALRATAPVGPSDGAHGR